MTNIGRHPLRHWASVYHNMNSIDAYPCHVAVKRLTNQKTFSKLQCLKVYRKSVPIIVEINLGFQGLNAFARLLL